MTSRPTASLGETKRSALKASALLGGNLLLLVACGGGGEAATVTPVATTPTAAVPAASGAGKTAATGTAGAVATAPTPAAAGTKAVTPTATGAAGSPTATTTTPATSAAAGTSATGTGGTTATAAAGAGTTAAAGGPSAGNSAAAGGGAAAPTVEGFPPEASCLADDTAFDKEGPFKYMAESDGATKMWIPMLPAGCKAPIVHLANGTGASCSNYQGSLNRMASHGFLTTCYEDANTGAGTQGVTAFKAVMKKHPDMFLNRLGSTGHSQGGQAAFTVLALAEKEFGLTDFIYAGLAMEPASGFGTQPAGGWEPLYKSIKSPMFMFSGTADMLVSQSWVQQAFDALDKSIEAYHWSAIGATHIPTPDPQEMEISIPWFRWKLLGDKKACEFYKKMPEGGKWKSIKEQNAKSCE
jgi:predicted esterase